MPTSTVLSDLSNRVVLAIFTGEDAPAGVCREHLRALGKPQLRSLL